MKSKETSPGMLRARSVRKNTPPFRTLTRCSRSSGKSRRISLASTRILFSIRAAGISGRTLSFGPCLLLTFAVPGAIALPRSRKRDCNPRRTARQSYRRPCRHPDHNAGVRGVFHRRRFSSESSCDRNLTHRFYGAIVVFPKRHHRGWDVPQCFFHFTVEHGGLLRECQKIHMRKEGRNLYERRSSANAALAPRAGFLGERSGSHRLPIAPCRPLDGVYGVEPGKSGHARRGGRRSVGRSIT